MLLAVPLFAAGNKNDLAYFGYDELQSTSAVGSADSIVVFESNIPKKGGTVNDILTLASTQSATDISTALDSYGRTVQVSVSLAELNAGKTLIAAVTGSQILVTDVNIVCDGSFGALTSAEIEDSSATVNICSVAQAQMTDDAVLSKGIAGFTAGVGMGEGVTVSESVVITKTGSNATTATGLVVTLHYILL